MSRPPGPAPAGLSARDMPDFSRALCLPGRSAVPQRAWDGDGSQEELEQAASVCRACPLLAQCSDWLGSLRPSRRPSGIVAGRRLVPRGETAAYARRQPPAEHVTAHAGLATAAASAGGPAVIARRGLTREQEGIRRWRAAHPEKIATYNATYYSAHREEITARKREQRARRRESRQPVDWRDSPLRLRLVSGDGDGADVPVRLRVDVEPARRGRGLLDHVADVGQRLPDEAGQPLR